MLFGLIKTKAERETERRDAKWLADFEYRRMYSPKSNPRIRLSQSLLRLAEREVAYRDDSAWTNNMLEKASGLRSI